MMTGSWPKEQVDHINGKRSDNRFANLREANNAENHQNLKKALKRKTGRTSRFLGVSYDKSRGRWMAVIGTGGKARNLGRFDTEEEAHAAYLAEKRRIHPFGTI